MLRRTGHVLSLFDFSGEWSGPYLRAGYSVTRVDIKSGTDIMLFRYRLLEDVVGILAAPPCTDFTISGSRWWSEKDKSGQTEESLRLVHRTLQIVRHFKKKLRWWALENPVGRLPKLVPQLGKAKLVWHPWWYGDFNPNLKRTPVEPVMYEDSKGNRGSWMWAKLGGKSERTKELRSHTPSGFARAYFEANP